MIPALLLSNQVPQAGALAGGEGPDLLRYLLVCGFLILVIAGLGFGFRRLMGAGMRGRGARRALQVVDVLPLGGKAKVAVVRCYDRSYLLGIGDKEIRLLDALASDANETDEAPELTALAAPAALRRAGGFLDALRSRLGDPASRGGESATRSGRLPRSGKAPAGDAGDVRTPHATEAPPRAHAGNGQRRERTADAERVRGAKVIRRGAAVPLRTRGDVEAGSAAAAAAAPASPARKAALRKAAAPGEGRLPGGGLFG
jgi:flagellar biogenesis protein FliO